MTSTFLEIDKSKKKTKDYGFAEKAEKCWERPFFTPALLRNRTFFLNFASPSQRKENKRRENHFFPNSF